MPPQPRLALVTTAKGSGLAPASAACLAGLTRSGLRIQHFRSQAALTRSKSLSSIVGSPGRHLDPWLMSPEVCRELFLRGIRRADVAVVEGGLQLAPPGPSPAEPSPGDLRGLIEALDLPVIVVVDCPRLEGLHLPAFPRRVDGLILDGILDPSTYPEMRTIVSAIARCPVVGGLEALPELRSEMSARADSQGLSEAEIDRLATNFLQFADLGLLRTIAESRSQLEPSDVLPRLEDTHRRFRVAYAHDQAFGGYFPDTLETLEAMGAELQEFSPLRDEELPAEVDLVMIGCGEPEHFLNDLAANVSLINALRVHVCLGQRIYCEGGGTAYLGQWIEANGRRVPGAGIFPFTAVLQNQPPPPQPVSRSLRRNCWLGPIGTTVRAYRSMHWKLRPVRKCESLCVRTGTLTREGDWYFHHHALGGLLHLHLASLPEVVRAFAGPHQPSLLNTPRA